MARPLRIVIPDGWYHVMSRGNRRATLFWDDTDRRRFLGLVSELPEPNGSTLKFTRSCSWTTTTICWCARPRPTSATRYGGHRLEEVAGKVQGLKYQAAAQGVRRF